MPTLTAAAPKTSHRTMQDLLDRLGNVPASRVRMQPHPGTATEKDVVSVNDHDNRTCELIDGTLVEKGMGFGESVVAAILIALLEPFVRERGLGVVSGPDGTMKFKIGLVRAPDVAFISRSQMRRKKVAHTPIPQVIPDLAIEIISKSNTRREMERKRTEYLAAGVKLVWMIDRRARRATVYTSADQATVIPESGQLNGGDVLPGFVLSLKWLFAEIDKQLED
jgi:Uma2 family endonuclease